MLGVVRRTPKGRGGRKNLLEGRFIGSERCLYSGKNPSNEDPKGIVHGLRSLATETIRDRDAFDGYKKTALAWGLTVRFRS